MAEEIGRVFSRQNPHQSASGRQAIACPITLLNLPVVAHPPLVFAPCLADHSDHGAANDAADVDRDLGAMSTALHNDAGLQPHQANIRTRKPIRARDTVRVWWNWAGSG